MKAIEVLSISKRYGKVPALDRVSFDVNPGESVALVGPNGAGKTTLLRILATLMKPTAGHARILDMDGRFRAAAIRRRIGYMPDVSVVMDDLTVREYLEFFAGVYGLGGATAKERVDDLVGLLDLGPVIERPSAALSRGMQQRLGLARTLIHNPDILLLDEPAANLDPRARVEMREVLKELQRMGKTILISSHILAELGELCDLLLLMQAGTIVHVGPIAELERRFALEKRLTIRVAGDATAFADALAAEPPVEQVEIEDGWLRVRLKPDVEDTSFVLRCAMAAGATLRELREERPGLEDVFMRLTRKGDGE